MRPSLEMRANFYSFISLANLCLFSDFIIYLTLYILLNRLTQSNFTSITRERFLR